MCRGCANRLPTSNSGVDIFGDNASSNLTKEINIRKGIELITGLAVSTTDGLPGRLCAECNAKLEGFLAFRAQLLKSLRVFLSPDYNSECSNRPSEARRRVNAPIDQGVTNRSTVLPVAPPLSNAEIDSDDASGSELHRGGKIELLQRRENKTVLEYNGNRSSGESDKINVCDEDVESEIDVCSGDDDEVLELDVQSRKDEIYEIESSGESDIQVCDYESQTPLSSCRRSS